MRVRRSSLFWWAVVASVILPQVVRAGTSTSRPPITIEDACQEKEVWNVRDAEKAPALAASVEQYQRFLAGTLAPALAMPVALQLAKDSKTKAWGEFWIARIYLKAGMFAIADEKLNRLFASTPADDRTSVPFATLACLGTIYKDFPTFGFSEDTKKRLTRYLRDPARKSERDDLMENAAVLAAVPFLALSKSSTDLALSKALQETGGLAARYLTGMQAAKSERPKVAIDAIRDLLKSGARKKLASQQDDFRLMLGRARYASGNYGDALDEWEQIESSSRVYATAQSDSAWGWLKSGKLQKVVEFARKLPRSDLRDAFLPEPLLVAAIAYHQRCLYPEALAAARTFRRTYAPVVHWLTKFRDLPATQRPTLYPQALAILGQHPTALPPAIATQWAHSPSFLALHERLGSLAREEAARDKWLVTARESHFPDATAQRTISAGIEVFRIETEKFLQRLPNLRADYQQRIQHELVHQTMQMAHQLKDIDDNLQLLEVDVLNGGTKEIMTHSERPSDRMLAMTTNVGNEADDAKLFDSEMKDRCTK